MSHSKALLCTIGIACLFILASCSDPEPRIVYVTATPEVVSSVPAEIATVTPANVESFGENVGLAVELEVVSNTVEFPESHVVVSGDTLSGIAQRYGTSIEMLLELNGIQNADVISVGQVIQLPDMPSEMSPANRLLPDRRLVRGPDSGTFSTRQFVASQSGYIRDATDDVSRRNAVGLSFVETLPAYEVIEEVAIQFSVDPRLLLTFLEYRAGWLTRHDLSNDLRDYPLVPKTASDIIDRNGLYRQLSWVANELNRGYYRWKYDEPVILEFANGNRILLNTELNPATAALHYVLHLENDVIGWSKDISENGFVETYRRLFGNPFADGDEPLITIPLEQPEFSLPFQSGEIWYFTGGMHGGWGNGSAWSAVDFAPPDENRTGLCFVSDYWVTAMAPGMIVYSDNGLVILDIDGDGDDTTGWSLMYLHLAEEERIPSGVSVSQGDKLGRPSCEGGFSTATHVHIARRYNGEWLPATCFSCSQSTFSDFNIGGWSVVGIQGDEYQGFLRRNGEERVAEQGRDIPINQVSW